MSSENPQLVICYNRGCGKKFDLNQNNEESCTFHPGDPVFHDAYKGWSCCNKRCTDFTEFLNIKGCTKSFHSNVKPPEPVKPVIDKSKANEIIEYKAPEPKVSNTERPSYDLPLTLMKPDVSSLLKTQMENLIIKKKEIEISDEISVGTNCKNGGCKATYAGPESNEEKCTYHPGVPIFHEGLKFWSCCQKRTTDFTAFLDQVGCQNGNHIWVQKKSGNTQAMCRYDWHQTGSDVIISIYAKKYDPVISTVELNPVRVKIHLLFPEEKSSFVKDMELKGVINVSKSKVSMLQTKVEIKLKKAEPGNWTKLDIEKSPLHLEKPVETPQNSYLLDESLSVDLSDIY